MAFRWLTTSLILRAVIACLIVPVFSMLVALWLFSDTKHLDLLDKSPGLRSGWEDVKQHLKIEEKNGLLSYFFTESTIRRFSQEGSDLMVRTQKTIEIIFLGKPLKEDE
ncbi:uncharacterized protein LOC134855607 [Symsagittifera roscoffensis]|uniref:uncharacterized protein LOC134855607 n=1 Tax=Symsagittifera roscoffensis TaxID=84072 RepID=UPI00307C96AB